MITLLLPLLLLPLLLLLLDFLVLYQIDDGGCGLPVWGA